MIITDGVTSVTLQGAENASDSSIIKSTKISADGGKKTKTAGERFFADELVRCTPAKLRELLDLITNNANEYFYTPENTPPDWIASDFPMSVEVTYNGKSTRGTGLLDNVYGQIYHVRLRIEATELVNK